MKLLGLALLITAASAAIPPQQQILRLPEQRQREASQTKDAWSKPLHELKQSLKTLTGEARATWDEVAMMFPEQMSKASFFSAPKKHTKRPDHEWDYLVRGDAVQSVWVENENGEREREVDGKLEQYDLRVKKVDPSELGVDPGVKQYSGYLDDNENDKHLFYCTRLLPPA